MADSKSSSKYVKLKKHQTAPTEEIKPGELNQPIEVPQLKIHKCNECGQPLPPDYRPPADEQWTTGISGCAEEPESCWTGLFCPCVLFGRNYETLGGHRPWTGLCICHALFVEGGIALAAAMAMFHGIDPGISILIGEGLLFSWLICGIETGMPRQLLQKKYHLKNSPCNPCMVHCCLHWCALCQEHREMKGRLSDDILMPMTTINPRPVQQMDSDDANKPSPVAAANDNNLEMQPI